MLKKNSPIKFKRPESVMGSVLCAIENGYITLEAIKKHTGLRSGQVTAAIANLAYVGAIKTGKRDENRKAIYTLQGKIEGFPECLKGVRWVFEPR